MVYGVQTEIIKYNAEDAMETRGSVKFEKKKQNDRQ